jgi:excisionase family DNA binding protein
MTLLAQLREMTAHLPPGGSITLPGDWLRAELASEPEGGSHVDPERLADLTVGEVAEQLNRGASTVRGWIAAGAFPHAYRLQRREWRVPPDDVRAFLLSQRHEPGARPAPRVKRNEPVDLRGWRNLVPQSTRRRA